MRIARRFLGAFGLLATLASTGAGAQGLTFTSMSVAGFPLTVTGTTPDNFDSGSILFGNTSFTVNLILNFFGNFNPRVTTVQVRCGAPCPASVAQVQWRRADLSTWNSLSTAFVTIETRTAYYNGTNDPWSQTLQWRYLLNWATTPPVVSLQFPIDFQLVVTAP
ncbi:MAG: hypothetical protein KF709_13370 [Gemmatimonadaceae bacterium]|nr:hypothetical protein [Gemmatimonadaceae bacterium]